MGGGGLLTASCVQIGVVKHIPTDKPKNRTYITENR